MLMLNCELIFFILFIFFNFNPPGVSNFRIRSSFNKEIKPLRIQTLTNFYDQKRENQNDQVIEKTEFVKLQVKSDPVKSNHRSTQESEYTEESV